MLRRYLLKDMNTSKRYIIYTSTTEFGIGEYIMTFDNECCLVMNYRIIK